jgi:enolase
MKKTFTRILNEMVYGGNIGFQEMAEFYQKATSKEIKQMEKIIRAEDWAGFKKLIKRVLKVTLA